MAPPHKRRRLDGSDASVKTGSLFAPFRALGYISNHVPCVLQVQSSVGLQKPAFNIVSCLGRSWAMWSGKDLKLLFVGPEASQPLESVAVRGNHVFAASGHQVFRYLRGRTEATYSAPADDGVGKIIIFGQHLLGLDRSGRQLWVWNIEDGSLYTTIHFPPGFNASHIVHPATYINKILVGSQQGGLQIWNIATATLIYTFEPHVFSTSPSPVTALVQSPAVDVVVIGFESGRVIAYDIRMGAQLFSIQTSTMAHATSLVKARPAPAVTAISFRTDNVAHTLATATADGTLSTWDLDVPQEAQQPEDEPASIIRLLHTLPLAHDGTIGSLEWLQGQPLLISSGADNSIKQWAFDTPTAEPRLLKYRSGHSAPPSFIRYYGDDGKAILSAGGGSVSGKSGADDRALRYTSVVRDSRSFELSQGSIARRAKAAQKYKADVRAPPIVAAHFSMTRSRDWDDVVTCHVGLSTAYSWSVENKRRGAWTFADSETDKISGVARCCTVTACGNFALIGFSSGIIGMWNMQSGLRRRTFDLRDGNGRIAISGVVCDALNQQVVASSQDGMLHWFDFHTTKKMGCISLPAGISGLVLHRNNNLMGTLCDDLAVRIVDLESRRIVREFAAFRGRIVDLAFTPDSRWLVVGSADAVIRTFDVPTGRLIDAFRVPTAVTSLTFSPTGDFLATSHVDSIGINLWANRAQFVEIPFRNFEEEDIIPELSLPDAQGDEHPPPELLGFAAPTQWTELADALSDAKATFPGLVQLSEEPRSKWQTLLNLDTIRARNKPTEPPKAPEKAPFFLPTLSGPGDTRFDVSATEKTRKSDSEMASRLAISTASVQSAMSQLLQQQDASGSYDEFFARLFSLSASALDLELRTIAVDDLAPLFRALTARLRADRDYEAVQAVLAVLLRIHGDVLVGLNVETLDTEREEALAALEELGHVQAEGAKRLGRQIGFALGALGFVRNMTLAM